MKYVDLKKNVYELTVRWSPKFGQVAKVESCF